MSATEHPPTVASIADDLLLANDVDVEWWGYGKADFTDPERPFIPIEEYAPDGGGIIARYRVWLDIERVED